MKFRSSQLSEFILRDLQERMVLLSGPRQVGKTTFSRTLKQNHLYLNYDIPEDRVLIESRAWRNDLDLLIFDELHKMSEWKNFLKGLYDSPFKNNQILVTGSARLDIAKKMGDSLAGRFFGYRLHPLDLKELSGTEEPEEIINKLMTIGGFPEPYFKGSETFYRRWKRSHIDVILRQDLIDLENVRDILKIETMLELLRHRVGSPVSYSSLARDLEKDPSTIKRWLDILENLYIIFRVNPYHKNIARSILKEPKFYFYDMALVEDLSFRFENLVACALRKELDRIEDFEGYPTSLHYLKTKDGKELDFLVIVDNKPKCIIEVKLNDDTPSKNFKVFSDYFPGLPKFQILRYIHHEKDFEWGLKMRRASGWLTQLDLLKIA